MKLEGWIVISKDDNDVWVADSDEEVLRQIMKEQTRDYNIRWNDPISFSGHISITIPPSGEEEK